MISLLSTFSNDRKIDAIVIKHVIQQHQHQVITSEDNEDVQRIHIRRSHVFSDALRQFAKRSFDVSKMLQVRFLGEEAVDEGGPRRELFHLLTHEMFRSSLFVGFPNHVIPVHNIKAVGDSVYYTIGKMLSTCIIQGGEVPVCFAKAVADYLVFDRVCSPVCLEDIPDHEVQDCLQKVSIREGGGGWRGGGREGRRERGGEGRGGRGEERGGGREGGRERGREGGGREGGERGWG